MRKAASILLLCSLPAAGASCAGLMGLTLDHVTITVAEARDAGAFAVPSSGRSIPMPLAFCRVEGSIKPASGSDIRFEVWMPTSDWNGRFQGVGNGGYAGSITYPGLADAVAHRYASASTDTGHQSASGTTAEWALKQPEKIVDFGYRAIHETAVAAKRIIAAFYGDAPKYSYFNSCSNGGRQALMEAERFPADYDGILAGAPAWNWTSLLSASAYLMKAMKNDPAAAFSAAKLPAIQAAALARCDALDGVKDGVIDNPMACHFDPAVLLCKGAESDTCLTAPQVATLTKVYAGMKGSKGQALFPGLSPGGEAETGWDDWITGRFGESGEGMTYGNQFFRYMVYSDPAWRFQSFDPDRDLKAATDKLGPVLDASNPDLNAFRQRGGRLILYHGWADPAIPALSTVDFYQRLSAAMGPAGTQETVRLYMVPGMGHCGGGAGPNLFGQLSVPRGDPQYDMDAALETWVEKGVEPGPIVAAKAVAGKVIRTRPLCPWPSVAKWKGAGSTGDAANFSCAQP